MGFTQKFIQLQGENLKIRFSELIQIWTKAVPYNCHQRTSSLIGYYINWMKVHHEVVIFQLLRAQILGSSLMTFFSHTLYSVLQGIILSVSSKYIPNVTIPTTFTGGVSSPRYVSPELLRQPSHCSLCFYSQPLLSVLHTISN